MRKLTLKKENVADLTPDELSSVVGAAQTLKNCLTQVIRCLPTDDCSQIDGCLTAQICGR